VIVAAAGNDGTTEEFFPAAFDHVVSVGAFDEDHRRASFSNYGNWVDISAPGNEIMGAYPMFQCGGVVGEPGDQGCYNWLSGTSMASPHVAGAAALLFSHGATSNTQVVNLLFDGADGDGVASVRLDSWTIHGGLNIHDSLSLGTAAPTPTPANTATPTVIATNTPTPTATPTNTPTATPPTVDTVVITKVTYNSRRDELKIEATSTGAPGAMLTAYDISDSDLRIGQLTYNSKKKIYAGTSILQSGGSVDSSRAGRHLVTEGGFIARRRPQGSCALLRSIHDGTAAPITRRCSGSAMTRRSILTRVLGMRLVQEQPNMDDPNSVHLFFEKWPGQFIAYFVPKRGSDIEGRVQPGALNHIALNLDGDLEEAMAALRAEGVAFSGPIDRGYERSVYFRDPNGIVVELLTWITPVPDGVDEGDLILAAQSRRLGRGAYAIDDEDVRAAIADL
jgi:catechol 2,3-dioxygenase-like lactoylglutathione lyase family enzyme